MLSLVEPLGANFNRGVFFDCRLLMKDCVAGMSGDCSVSILGRSWAFCITPSHFLGWRVGRLRFTTPVRRFWHHWVLCRDYCCAVFASPDLTPCSCLCLLLLPCGSTQLCWGSCIALHLVRSRANLSILSVRASALHGRPGAIDP